MSFPCTKCGACCRDVNTVPELAHLDAGGGVCRHLTAENLCAIYDERPKQCRVDDMQPTALTREGWYRRNEADCNRLHLAVYGTPRAA